MFLVRGLWKRVIRGIERRVIQRWRKNDNRGSHRAEPGGSSDVELSIDEELR